MMTFQDYYRSCDDAKRAKVAIAGRMFSVMFEAMDWLGKDDAQTSDSYKPTKRFYAMAKCYAGLWRGFCEVCEHQYPRWNLEHIWDEHVKYGFVALPENASSFRAAHNYLIDSAFQQPAPQAEGSEEA